MNFVLWKSLHFTLIIPDFPQVSLNFNPIWAAAWDLISVTSKSSDQPVHQHSLTRAFASSLNILTTVMLLTEQHLEFLSLTRDCIGLSESIYVKMPHCWKSHVTAHFFLWRTQQSLNLFGINPLSAIFLPQNVEILFKINLQIVPHLQLDRWRIELWAIGLFHFEILSQCSLFHSTAETFEISHPLGDA